MAPDIVHPLFFTLNALVFRGQYSITQTLCEHRPRCDFIHPLDAFGEDFCVYWVLEVPRVDRRRLERVGAGDVDASAGQGMF